MDRWCRKRAPARSEELRATRPHYLRSRPTLSLSVQVRSRETERARQDESRRRRKSFSSSEGCSRGRWPRFLAIHFQHRDHRSRLQCRFWGGCSLVRKTFRVYARSLAPKAFGTRDHSAHLIRIHPCNPRFAGKTHG